VSNMPWPSENVEIWMFIDNDNFPSVQTNRELSQLNTPAYRFSIKLVYVNLEIDLAVLTYPT
jgi:hypothetical protein